MGLSCRVRPSLAERDGGRLATRVRTNIHPRGSLLSSLAVILATTWVASAAAQPAPAAQPSTAPAGAPVASPPPKDESDIPPALKPSRFRFSTLGWSQSATTTMLGVGRDNIGGEDESYSMDFSFAPQYWFYDEKDDKLFVNAQIGMTVEVTDSGTTTTRREPQFNDLQLGLGYNRSIFTSENGEWLTRLFLRGRGIFPTSPISMAQGRYFTSSLGASILQVFKLLGNDADGLNNLTVLGGATWTHLFARSYTPTNSSLERTRQTASGASILDDQLSFNSMDIDRLIPTLFLSLPIYKDLTLNNTWRLIGRFRHQFEGTDCDIVVSGECVDVDQGREKAPTYLTNSSFDVSLTQGFYNIAFLTAGYNNETLTLGEDGQNRNVFYSPSAVFYLDLSFQLDQVYSKIAEGKGGNRNPFVQAGAPATIRAF